METRSGEKKGESNIETNIYIEIYPIGQIKEKFFGKISRKQEEITAKSVYAGWQQGAGSVGAGSAGAGSHERGQGGMQQRREGCEGSSKESQGKGRPGRNRGDEMAAGLKVSKAQAQGKKTSLRVASWNKGGANQDLWKKEMKLRFSFTALT